jgi:transposase
MLLSEGQMNDYKGAALMLDILPRAKAMQIVPCIPSKANRKRPIAHDQTLYRQRHKIENMFGKLKDWRRIHTRYDRCAHTFFSTTLVRRNQVFCSFTGIGTIG